MSLSLGLYLLRLSYNPAINITDKKHQIMTSYIGWWRHGPNSIFLTEQGARSYRFLIEHRWVYASSCYGSHTKWFLRKTLILTSSIDCDVIFRIIIISAVWVHAPIDLWSNAVGFMVLAAMVLPTSGFYESTKNVGSSGRRRYPSLCTSCYRGPWQAPSDNFFCDWYFCMRFFAAC